MKILALKEKIKSRRAVVVAVAVVAIAIVAGAVAVRLTKGPEVTMPARTNDLVLTIIDKPTGAYLPGRDIKVEAKVKVQCVDDLCNDTAVWQGVTNGQGEFSVPKDIARADYTVTVQGFKPVDMKSNDKDAQRVEVIE